ncbi:MAG: hypothetical protein LC798_20150 [Chloroflexi bacterium]|nr:hypothetical protein [Chloroflexota bacterium]
MHCGRHNRCSIWCGGDAASSAAYAAYAASSSASSAYAAYASASAAVAGAAGASSASASAAAYAASSSAAAAADPVAWLDSLLDAWEKAVNEEGEALWVPTEWEDEAIAYLDERNGAAS